MDTTLHHPPRPLDDHIAIQRLRRLRCLRRFLGPEKSFDQIMHLGQPRFDLGAQLGRVTPHKGGQPIKLLCRIGQQMRLRIAQHLHPVFDLAMRAVMPGQRLGGVAFDPARLRQPVEPLNRDESNY